MESRTREKGDTLFCVRRRAVAGVEQLHSIIYLRGKVPVKALEGWGLVQIDTLCNTPTKPPIHQELTLHRFVKAHMLSFNHPPLCEGVQNHASCYLYCFCLRTPVTAVQYCEHRGSDDYHSSRSPVSFLSFVWCTNWACTVLNSFMTLSQQRQLAGLLFSLLIVSL